MRSLGFLLVKASCIPSQPIQRKCHQQNRERYLFSGHNWWFLLSCGFLFKVGYKHRRQEQWWPAFATIILRIWQTAAEPSLSPENHHRLPAGNTLQTSVHPHMWEQYAPRDIRAHFDSCVTAMWSLLKKKENYLRQLRTNWSTGKRSITNPSTTIL